MSLLRIGHVALSKRSRAPLYKGVPNDYQLCVNDHIPTVALALELTDSALQLRYVVKFQVRKMLLSNVIDSDHQNSCLFTNKGHFSSPLWVLIGVPAKFHE